MALSYWFWFLWDWGPSSYVHSFSKSYSRDLMATSLLTIIIKFNSLRECIVFKHKFILDLLIGQQTLSATPLSGLSVKEVSYRSFPLQQLVLMTFKLSQEMFEINGFMRSLHSTRSEWLVQSPLKKVI